MTTETINTIGFGRNSSLLRPTYCTLGTESPNYTTWRSHLGTAMKAVPTGIYPVMLPNSRFGALMKAGSMGCRPVREPDARVFTIRSLLAVCKTKVAMVRRLPARFRCNKVDECGIARGYNNRNPKDRDSNLSPVSAYESEDQYYDVFSASLSDRSRTELSISDISTTGIVQKHSGLEEVLRNLKKLSISDPEKKGVPEDWVRQPPAIFSGKWDENVTKFLKSFTAHVDSMKLNLESAELISYFKEYLKGEALRISDPLAVIYPEWNEFVEKFSDRFNGKERIKRAKAELVKLNLYSEEVLFIFARLKAIFDAMDLTDQTEQITEILKKASTMDRNRILDKGLETFSEVMEYFLTEEDRQKRFGKSKRELATYSNSKTSNSQSDPFSPKSQVKIVTTSSGKDMTRIKCFRCELTGHYARDYPTYASKATNDLAEVKTPKQENTRVRKIPFSTGITAPESKRLDVSNTPTPIRKLLEKKLDVNLVELRNQYESTKEVTAVTGIVEVNGITSKFQYDSGASVNIISEDLACSMELGPVMNCAVKIMPINGISQPVKLLPNVKLRFKEFECSTDLHVLKTHKKNLLLLGIGLFAKIGAEVSLKDRQMVIESGDSTHRIPLNLETRELSKVMAPHEVLNTDDSNYELVNPKLSTEMDHALNEILSKYQDSFADKLEELNGAKVEPCEIELLIKHKEGKSNPTDFLSRFPWQDIPPAVDEVMYVTTEQYREFKDRILQAENSMQLGTNTSEQEGLTEKFSTSGSNIYFKRKDRLVKYIPPEELRSSILKLHEEQHQNAYSTFKALTNHYYIPGSYSIVKEIVEQCESCQRNNFAVRRTTNFQGIQVTGPFQTWGIDVAGPLPATKIYKNKYIIVAVDYFTKWPVAVAVPEVNASVIIAFICEQILATFGVPSVLVSDRGTHLTLRTSSHRTLGTTPAEIVYGLDLVTPAVWESQSLPMENGTGDNFENRVKFLSEILPTYRKAAYDSGVKSKTIEAQYYNNKVRPRKFKIGDQVLKALAEPYSALGDRSVGPFEVSAILGDGVYEITDTKGNSDNVHSDRLTRYSSARGMVPVVRTRLARSTLPALIRPFKGKVHEDVLI
ncbi:Gag-Pol polyprotein [Smittium culicis]|uniref:Gag-Pol polyprotein n=1 Tax=Smittium culicis TaxID=133412 RepID=A0A1R1YHM3_9FUNG|nr:Gag-Pol polyprotein [Smittium culicis]